MLRYASEMIPKGLADKLDMRVSGGRRLGGESRTLPLD